MLRFRLRPEAINAGLKFEENGLWETLFQGTSSARTPSHAGRGIVPIVELHTCRLLQRSIELPDSTPGSNGGTGRFNANSSARAKGRSLSDEWRLFATLPAGCLQFACRGHY